MFHHCNHPIRFGHFENLELPRRCIVTWHLLAANSKLVKNFEPSSEHLLWCWQQRKIVSEYSQLACEWLLHNRKSAFSVTRRYQTGPESGTISYRFCSHENENGTVRYDIVSFQFLVHFSVPPNFWTCFGTDRLIFFRTRVNATPLRTTFWNGPKWNGTISYPCEQGPSKTGK